jgi:hypothetical protein
MLPDGCKVAMASVANEFELNKQQTLDASPPHLAARHDCRRGRRFLKLPVE